MKMHNSDEIGDGASVLGIFFVFFVIVVCWVLGKVLKTILDKMDV